MFRQPALFFLQTGKRELLCWRYFGAHLCQQALNALLQATRMRANQAPDWSSTREEYQCWNALDAKAGGHEYVFVGIHLRKAQLALVAAAEPRKVRGQYAARRAPICGEFNDDWERGLKHTLFKVLVTYEYQVRVIFCHSLLSIPLGKPFEETGR